MSQLNCKYLIFGSNFQIITSTFVEYNGSHIHGLCESSRLRPKLGWRNGLDKLNHVQILTFPVVARPTEWRTTISRCQCNGVNWGISSDMICSSCLYFLDVNFPVAISAPGLTSKIEFKPCAFKFYRWSLSLTLPFFLTNLRSCSHENYGRIRRTADTKLNYTKKARKTTDYLQVVNKMFVFVFFFF